MVRLANINTTTNAPVFLCSRHLGRLCSQLLRCRYRHILKVDRKPLRRLWLLLLHRHGMFFVRVLYNKSKGCCCLLGRGGGCNCSQNKCRQGKPLAPNERSERSADDGSYDTTIANSGRRATGRPYSVAFCTRQGSSLSACLVLRCCDVELPPERTIELLWLRNKLQPRLPDSGAIPSGISTQAQHTPLPYSGIRRQTCSLI